MRVTGDIDTLVGDTRSKGDSNILLCCRRFGHSEWYLIMLQMIVEQRTQNTFCTLAKLFADHSSSGRAIETSFIITLASALGPYQCIFQ